MYFNRTIKCRHKSGFYIASRENFHIREKKKETAVGTYTNIPKAFIVVLWFTTYSLKLLSVNSYHCYIF